MVWCEAGLGWSGVEWSVVGWSGEGLTSPLYRTFTSSGQYMSTPFDSSLASSTMCRRNGSVLLQCSGPSSSTHGITDTLSVLRPGPVSRSAKMYVQESVGRVSKAHQPSMCTPTPQCNGESKPALHASTSLSSVALGEHTALLALSVACRWSSRCIANVSS